MSEGIRLRRYQKKGVRLIENRFDGRALLADEMGLGKTPQAAAWRKKYIKKNVRTLVICEANLKYHWQDELMKFQLRSEVLSGRTPPLFKTLTDGPKIKIINYDILTNLKGKKSWEDWLKKWGPGVLIIDEGQKIKNRAAKRSKAVKRISKGIRNVLILTGTPATNEPAELWPLLNIIRPKLFPNFYDYAYEYCEPKLQFGRMTFKGAKNLDKLHRILKKTCIPHDISIQCKEGLIPIGELVEKRVKTKVLSYDHSSGKVCWRPIIAYNSTKKPNQMVRIVHEFGEFICTADHQIWTEKGYKRADSISPGLLLSAMRKES